MEFKNQIPEFQLVNVEGGTRHNVIPSDAKANFLIKEDNEGVVKKIADEYFNKLINKNVGILCNNNSKICERHLIDSLVIKGIKVSKIFTPEHGFYIDQPDGKKIFNDKYKTVNKNYVQIISLYGDKYKPTPFDLDNVDIILIDLQDVGVRCFTYISTIFYMMDACALKKFQ